MQSTALPRAPQSTEQQSMQQLQQSPPVATIDAASFMVCDVGASSLFMASISCTGARDVASPLLLRAAEEDHEPRRRSRIDK
jgi:hypothetical protein